MAKHYVTKQRKRFRNCATQRHSILNGTHKLNAACSDIEYIPPSLGFGDVLGACFTWKTTCKKWNILAAIHASYTWPISPTDLRV